MCDSSLTRAGTQDVALSVLEQRITAMAQQAQETNLQTMAMLREMAAAMRMMSEQTMAVNRQLQAMAQQIPLKPQQRTELTKAIRQRAVHLAEENGWAGDRRRTTLIANAIRATVRSHVATVTGSMVRAIGDIPSCQFAVAMELVGMWDSWATLDRIGGMADEDR